MIVQYIELPGGARLSFGADEFLFVELSEEMDLAVSLDVQSIVTAFTSAQPHGVVDVVPAHVSYMIRVDPDVLDPRELVPTITELHHSVTGSNTHREPIPTQIVEIPILYGDPWSHEVMARFRDRHPSPSESDLEFVARINGFDTVRALTDAHSDYPYIVTFNNFVPGNAECVQLVPREMQIEAPKYLRPRTDTPSRALGHGGNQATIYPTASPGGFQLLGRAAVPVVDFSMRGPGFTDSPALLRAPTVVKYAPIDLAEFEQIESSVQAGTYTLRKAELAFDLDAFTTDPLGYARALVGTLP